MSPYKCNSHTSMYFAACICAACIAFAIIWSIEMGCRNQKKTIKVELGLREMKFRRVAKANKKQHQQIRV